MYVNSKFYFLKTLNELNSAADKNTDNLRTVNNHLGERVSRSCNCWIWLMIMLIMIVFVMMVLFMKIFPKRKYLNEHYSTINYNQTLFVNQNNTLETMEL